MDNCLFCKVAKKDISSEIVYEDEKIVAFKDIAPQAPIHILIIPKAHYHSILDVPDSEMDIIKNMHIVAKKLSKDMGIAEDGFRLVNNCRQDGGQTVMHLHYHLLGGRNLTWPPG